ncbi:MAG: radical SAM protein [Candidatus Omnitrophica bacterium]|nr:radical SAM protein [Candidatus Omnitrophota bacterium]
MIQETLSSPQAGECESAAAEVRTLDSKPSFSHSYERFQLYLIKPSKYDEEAYVIRYWKGVLPSNTLACLCGLSEDIRDQQSFGSDLKWEITTIDETVQGVNIREIVKDSRRKNTRTVIGLVGVQSNQFPRAADLALAFRNEGLDVMIGGFHVSGIIATMPQLTPELAKLRDAGVTLVAGEVECGRWEMILQDVLRDQLKPIYNFLANPPELSEAPVPRISQTLMTRYTVKHFATLDCGRGCPFKCSFCTVINVQGRRMRYRSVDAVINLIRQNYQRHKISFYFFTDDNFCRNKNWEDLLDAFIKLREVEKIPLLFMIQVDTRSHLIPNFVEKAARAGCEQVFIGMESLNEENLKAVEKTQNNTDEFKRLIEAYHKAEIVTHLAYIIGFPFDSVESVRKDMQRLRNDLGAQQASFFMLTPLPGSMDYVDMVKKGIPVDADLNNYDSFHETFRHGRMKPGEWLGVYKEAWTQFYSVENMKAILKNTTPRKYWGVFMNFIWYKNSFQVEEGHPMVHGLVRLRNRFERRPGYPIEGRWIYFKRRVRELSKMLSGWIKLALEMEEVWLATRRRTPLEERVVFEMDRFQKRAQGWRNLRLPEVMVLYRRAAIFVQERYKGSNFPPIRVPSAFQLWLNKWNVFADSLMFTRKPINQFWRKTWEKFKQGRVHQINYLRLLFTGLRESVIFSRFILAIINYIKPIVPARR